MGIYGTFQYGYVFNRNDLTDDQINMIQSLSDKFCINEYENILTVSDKNVAISNDGLGIEMREIDKTHLLVEKYISSHQNEDGIVLKEFKTQKYSYGNDNTNSLKCYDEQCWFCDNRKEENCDERVLKKPRVSIEDTLQDTLRECKIVHSGWFNVVFYSGDMTTTVYLPLKK